VACPIPDAPPVMATVFDAGSCMIVS